MLKANPDDVAVPQTPLRLEPMTATTPYTAGLPVMPVISLNEQLKFPLSRDMGLYVLFLFPQHAY